MHNTTLMQVPDGIDNWADNIPGLLLRIHLLLNDLLIQLTPCEILQHEVDIFLISIKVIKLDNVGMLDVLHDINFPIEQDLFLLVHLLSLFDKNILFDDLDGDGLAG